jgi:hypothetical protein
MKPTTPLSSDQIEQIALEFAKRTTLDLLSADLKDNQDIKDAERYVSYFFKHLDLFITEFDRQNENREY